MNGTSNPKYKRMIDYHLFARWYGWKPSDVDCLPIWQKNMFLAIIYKEFELELKKGF